MSLRCGGGKEKEEELKKKGWTIEGEGQCTNPLCILGNNDSWKIFCGERQKDLDKVIQILYNQPRLVRHGYSESRARCISKIKTDIQNGNLHYHSDAFLSSGYWRRFINNFISLAKIRLSQIITKEKQIAIRRANWENAQRYISRGPPPDFKSLRSDQIHNEKKGNEKRGRIRK
jgi:hypothetical protein